MTKTKVFLVQKPQRIQTDNHHRNIVYNTIPKCLPISSGKLSTEKPIKV